MEHSNIIEHNRTELKWNIVILLRGHIRPLSLRATSVCFSLNLCLLPSRSAPTEPFSTNIGPTTSKYSARLANGDGYRGSSINWYQNSTSELERGPADTLLISGFASHSRTPALRSSKRHRNFDLVPQGNRRAHCIFPTSIFYRDNRRQTRQPGPCQPIPINSSINLRLDSFYESDAACVVSLASTILFLGLIKLPPNQKRLL